MLVISILSLFTFLAITGILKWKCPHCFKCASISLLVFFAAIYIANSFFTWFVNSDSHDADRNGAIAIALCNPPKNTSVETRDISCGATKTAYGFEIGFTSTRIMGAEEVANAIDRIRILKPIITSGRIHISFKQRHLAHSASGETPQGVPVTEFSYSYTTYKTADL